jgi:hypothetical protein
MNPILDTKVEGVEGLLRDFKGYEKEAEAAIDKAVKETAQKGAKMAKDRLEGRLGSKRHYHFGDLIKSVFAKKGNKKMEAQFGSYTCEYAPYIEFGTGDLVFTNFEFDEDARRVAAQYKGQGIRKVNIRGDSFLNYAAVEQAPKLRERITNELNAINKT